MALSLALGICKRRKGRKVPFPTLFRPYPDVAKKMHLAGTVKVQVVIGTDGRIKEKNFIGGHPVAGERSR